MLCYNDNFQFGTYYLNKCLPSVAYVLNKYLPSVAYVNYKLTCSNFSFVYRAGQSNLSAMKRNALIPFCWTNTDAWFKLSAWWGSDEFKRLSAMKRNARLSVPDAQNHGGSRSTARTQQCLVTMK